ncbi:MAG: Na/Pi symporter [Campylobacterales bacterium]|nr:Na/Pi symporter [Campylobacterales bacterium]
MNRNFIFLIAIILGTIFWYSKDAQIVLGGIALFFLGMYTLEHGMKNFAGGALESFLKKTTDTNFKAVMTGFGTTALVQSSSLVTLIAISFLGAGLIKLSAGIGIVFGSNLGTTATSWLVALIGLKLKISNYALGMAALGTVFNFSKSPAMRGVANILIGLALLLLAIGFMKAGFENVKATIDLSEFAVGGVKGLIIFTFVGIFATVVMQSSSATMALILTALATNQITYENSLALAIGANIGTTITAILGSLTSNSSGKKLALAHLIFNAVTGAIAIIFLSQFILAVDYLSNIFAFGDDPVMKLSLFHSIFNVVGILVMVPFFSKLEQFLHRVIKEKEVKRGKPKHLEESLIDDGTASIVAIKSEIGRLFENAFKIIAHTINLQKKEIRSNENIDHLLKRRTELMEFNIEDEYQSTIKSLHNDIVEFSTKAQVNMNEEEGARAYRLKTATRDIVEAIKDATSLRANVVKYSKSENEYIKKEYDLIRGTVAKILRKVMKIKKNPDKTENLSNFVALKQKLEDNDRLINMTVDSLIRDGKITPAMGTSLMNDSAYAYNIGEKLMEAIVILYISDNEELQTVYNHLIKAKG